MSYVTIFFQLNGDASSFQRKFVNGIRNCDEAERRISKSTASVYQSDICWEAWKPKFKF